MGVNTQALAVRSTVSGIWAVATYYAGNITPLFYLMIIFGLTDYTMWMAVAKWYPNSDEDALSRERALREFVKKLTYIFLMGVAWGIDFMILEAEQAFNLSMRWRPFFGIFALCYLILTEGISILESAERMGIKIPFLSSTLKVFREKVSKGPEKKGEE